MVPATTRIYESADIASVEPTATETEITAVFTSGQPAPVVGGHAALGRAPGLPYGMLTRVVSVDTTAGGQTSAVLASAPLDEVFDNVNYAFDGPVMPVLVDENDDPVPGSLSRSGDLIIRGDANRASTERAAPAGAFDCKESGGIPRNQDDVWTTGLPLPIEIKLENTKIVHGFDAGSAFPSRPPRLFFQFSGEAVASVGVEAKTGFECSLSTSFRRNHRIKLPIRNIGPVPISIYLEPVLRFSVSASGKIGISQRHYFTYTLEKRDTSPLSFRRGGSADPPQFEASARVGASLFAGGDLSLLIGAAGTKSTNLGAGIYGAFGPEFSLSTQSAQPGCITAIARLQADLGVRLQLWTKRWNLEVASLTSPDVNFPGSPFCGLPDPPPPPPPPPPGGSVIAAGNIHTCALRVGGTIGCWGYNFYGQLGDGTTTNALTPVSVTGISDATEITAGSEDACALRAGGTIRCWGYNVYGQLGDGTTTNSLTPVNVTGITNATQVTAGNGHTCALHVGGTISCWGLNTSGQLGNGTTTGERTPVSVTGISDATQIIAGGNSQTCALRTGGTISCWGNNNTGQLGNGTTTDALTPVSVTGISDATQVSAGSNHACARHAGGTISCWGQNGEGQLGNGTTSTTIGSLTPVAVTGITDATQITAGYQQTCALHPGGAISCWGHNGWGQLGNGTTTRSSTPVGVTGISDATQVATAEGHTCALHAAGPISCWGFNGELGNGTTDSSLTPVLVTGFP